MLKYRIPLFILFTALAIASLIGLRSLKFGFDFEQFFPKGDPDLEFFKSFIEDFETDDNFLLIAIESEHGVFNTEYLEKFREVTIKAQELPHVKSVLSLSKFKYPIKTPFGLSQIPAIHIGDESRYERDSIRVMNDERLRNNLISNDGKSLVVSIKTKDRIDLFESDDLISAATELLESYNFKDYHFLGIANFQKQMVDMEKREIQMSSIISLILVAIIIFIIYRSYHAIFIVLSSIGLGMLLFMGFLAATGRELDAMTALYPILLLIVGTSDVIHFMTKYVDELKKGASREGAIKTSIKEVGWATLLTSTTTAAGFFSLLTSKISSIQAFGINAAIGVLIAYVTVLLFTTSLLSFFPKEKLFNEKERKVYWHSILQKIYLQTSTRRNLIVGVSLGLIAMSFVGMKLITTNYKIESNMPRGEKLTEDFYYFEDQFSGFRPLEYAVFIQDGYNVDDFEVIQEIDKIEKKLKATGVINSIFSVSNIYKSLNMMHNNNKQEAYRLTDSESKHNSYKRYAEKIPYSSNSLIISKDKKKTRISSKIADIGADSIKVLADGLDNWIDENVDKSIIKTRRTGTGMIIDKNAIYVRSSLIQGLGLALLIVSFMMALLFRNFKMLLISLVPNILPLLFAAAIIGFIGVELEASVSILFAIVFGIAVDDTIHFLSKYKICISNGMEMEEAIQCTFYETGKAIIYTSIILFFGFLILLFSIHPPSVTVGILISITLISALIADLYLIPILIRKLL